MFRYVQNRVLFCLKLGLIIVDGAFFNAILAFALNCVGLLSAMHQSIWVIYNLLLGLLVFIVRLYSDYNMERLENLFRASIRFGVTALVLFGVFVHTDVAVNGNYKFLLIWAVAFSVYLFISRFLMTYCYTVLPQRFNWSKKLVLIGHGDQLNYYSNYFDKQATFYSVDTIEYKDADSLKDRNTTLAMFNNYFREIAKGGVHDVFVVATPDMYDYSKELVEVADHQCVQLNFVPTMTANITYLDNQENPLSLRLPVLKSHEEPMSSIENRLKKRIVDLLISGFVIVFILSWMIPIIGLLIKFQSRGPVFFKQPRSGRNNRTFSCYKFRSMVVNNASGKKQASKDDVRITPIGQFLRKTSLDEFPQFINVFLGQMSVVGPRPHMLSHTEHYSELIQHYMVRHFVKPGITGWAQVNGYRGETKDPDLMAKRVQYDIEYMRNWSAMLDFKIVFMTAFNIFKGEENAY